MAWYANISLKSGRNVVVSNLKSINKSSSSDSSVTKIVNFEEYHLMHGQKLTFVGESISTLISDEIEYVEFRQHD